MRIVIWATAVLLTSGCRRPDATRPSPADHAPVRIVVVSHGQAADPFWSVVKRGVDDAAREVGADVDYRAPETFDMVRMARLVESAVAGRPDGLALSIPDPSALETPISAAIAAGIAVVSFNSGRDAHVKLGIPLHIGQDEQDAGRRAGRRMAELGVKRALCVNHEVGNVALDRRCEGFDEGLEGSVEVVAVDLDPTKTRSRIQAVLGRSEATGVLVLGPTAAEPVLAAVKDLDRASELIVATFDLSPAMLDALADGRLAFALDQQQYLQGYLPVVLLASQARTGALPSSDVLTGPGFVTRENVEAVRAFTRAGLR
ncbi:MAG: sugar ABC transporter substrate-binding protein [Myxococcota bacterium]